MAMSRSFGGRSVTARSPIWTSPAVTSSSPATIRRIVDFPHPEGPTRTMNSPSPISSDTRSTATTSPNSFVTSSRTILATALPLPVAHPNPTSDGPRAGGGRRRDRRPALRSRWFRDLIHRDEGDPTIPEPGDDRRERFDHRLRPRMEQDHRPVAGGHGSVHRQSDHQARRPLGPPLLGLDAPMGVAVSGGGQRRQDPFVVGPVAERASEPRSGVDARGLADRPFGLGHVDP